MRYHRKQKQKSAGFTILEVGIAIAIAMLLSSLWTRSISHSTQVISDQRAAQQMQYVTDAARKYVQANSYVLAQTVPVGGGTIEIPVARTSSHQQAPAPYNSNLPSLQGGGYLSASFIDSGFHGQHYAFLIQQPTAGDIESIITTTGGQVLSDQELGQIVQYIKDGSGGSVMTNMIGGIEPGTLVGSGGAWSYAPGAWQSADAPVQGHYAANVNYAGQIVLQDFLYRHNIGIHEGNTMHTDIDANNNSLNNAHTVDSQYLQNTQSNNTGTLTVLNSNLAGSYQTNTQGFGAKTPGGGNAVGFKDGLYACTDNASGCGVQVSDDGGFYDNNDFWITYQGPGKGLHLAGQNNNLMVDHKIGAMGFDPNENLPNGLAGGMSSWDFVSHGGVYSIAHGTGNIGAYLSDASVGIRDDSGYTTIAYMQKNPDTGKGEIYASGRMGSAGYQPGQGDPQGWVGGLSTFDVVSHGTIAAAVDNNGVANVYLGGYWGGQNHGTISASESISGRIFRPTLVVTAGDSCTGNVNGAFGGQMSFALQNGDIARDSHGAILSCTDGIWSTSSMFQHNITTEALYQGVNNSDAVQFVTTRWHTDGNDNRHKWASVMLYVDGNVVCQQVGTENDWATCSAMVPVGSSWSTTTNDFLPGSLQRGEWTTIASAE